MFKVETFNKLSLMLRIEETWYFVIFDSMDSFDGKDQVSILTDSHDW